MTDTVREEQISLKSPSANAKTLCLTGAFLVVISAFVLHFTVMYTPLHGVELDAYFQDVLTDRPVFSTLFEGPAPPVTRFALPALWGAGGGTPIAIRITALLIHVAVSALVFMLLRVWLGQKESIIIPLVGALLAAAVPASVAAMAHVHGWLTLASVAFTFGACVFFLSATKDPSKRGLARLMLAAWCMVCAAVTSPLVVLVLPVLFFLLDISRQDENGRPRYAPDWLSHGALACAALTIMLLFYVNESPVILYGYHRNYAFFMLGIVALCRITNGYPSLLLRRCGIGILALLLPVGAVMSFAQALRYTDPESALEERLANSETLATRRQRALHFLQSAQQSSDANTRKHFLEQGVALWPLEETQADLAPWERLLLGNALLECGNSQLAHSLVAPLFSERPLDVFGVQAARIMVAASDENLVPQDIATLSAFLLKEDALTGTDILRYGRTLMRLGDLESAAQTYAVLAELPQDTLDGMLQRQVAAAMQQGRTSQDAHQAKLAKDSGDMSAYVDLAQANLLFGKRLRAFYVLENILRRAPQEEAAWNLMGFLFANANHPEIFIERWGTLRSNRQDSWLALARNTAMGRMWESAYTYAKHSGLSGEPSPEAFIAAIALETGQTTIAEHWAQQALAAWPESYSTRLLLADIALAAADHTLARQYLQEARDLGAPEEKLNTRNTRLDETPLRQEAPDSPFEPVRTYIR